MLLEESTGTATVESLRRCLRDLVAVSALPALWSSSSPREIADQTADILGVSLRAKLILVHLYSSGSPIDVLRLPEQREEAEVLAKVKATLVDQLVVGTPGEPAWLPDPTGNGRVRVLVAPIGHHPQWGTILLGSTADDFPDEAERALLSIVSNQAAVWLQNVQLVNDVREARDSLRRQNLVLAELSKINQLLSAELDLDRLVDRVVEAACELSGAEIGAFFYNDEDESGGLYKLYSLHGAPREQVARFPSPRNTQLFSRTYSGEGIVRAVDVRGHPEFGRMPPYYGLPPGHPPVVSYLAVPVISRTGKVLGGIFLGHRERGIFTDEAEELVSKLAVQAAIAIDNAHLYREVTQANREKDEFLGLVSHELRTPLTTLLGGTHFLQKSRPASDQAQAELLCDMRRDAERLQRLVDDLLVLARLELGARIVTEPVLIQRVVERAVEDFSRETPGRPVNIQIEGAIPTVVGTETYLSQVIRNLLGNADKYSPPTAPIDVRIATQKSGEVVVSVRDHGPGIAEEERERIFDIFFRSGQNPKLVSGAGIGLSVCKRLIEAQGGRIWAVNAPRGGLNVCFSASACTEDSL